MSYTGIGKRNMAKLDDRIDARLPAETKQLIERAACIAGVTVSEFIIVTAHEAAVVIVKRHEALRGIHNAQKAFVELLANDSILQLQ